MKSLRHFIRVRLVVTNIGRFGLLVALMSLWSLSLGAVEGVIERQVGGRIHDMVSAGDHTYVSQGATVVTVSWDDNGSASVTDVSAPLPGMARNLLVDEDTLLVSVQSELNQGRIERFSLENPSQPRRIGSWVLPDGQWGLMKRVGDFLYVGSEGRYLTVLELTGDYDFQTASQMELAPDGLSNETVEFTEMSFWGEHHLLVAVRFKEHWGVGNAWTSGLILYMLDISDSRNPVEVARFQSSYMDGSILAEPLVFMVGDGRYHVINWSDVVDPQEVAYSGPTGIGGSWGVWRDGFLFINLAGIRAYDVSDPNDFQIHSSLQYSREIEGMSDRYVMAAGGEKIVVASTHAELAIIDISDTAQPSLEQILDLPPGENVMRIREVENGVLTVDTHGLRSLTSGLEPIGRFYAPGLYLGYYMDLVVHQDWLVLGVRSLTSLVMRLHNLSDIEPLVYVSGRGNDSLWLDGDSVWTIEPFPWSEVRRFHITDPDQPQLLSFETTRDARALIRKGNHVYIGEYDRGLGVHRLLADHSLSLVDRIPGCQVMGMDVQNIMLAAACNDAGLWLLDLTDPAQPELISTFDPGTTEPLGRSVMFDRNQLWFGHYLGVELLDISVPERPLHLASFPILPLLQDAPDSKFGKHMLPQRLAWLSPARSGGVWLAASTSGMAELRGPKQVGTGHTGAWHDPELPGQGLVLEVLDDQLALVTWFEYDSRGKQRWLQGIGAINDNRIDIAEVYRPIGTSFAKNSSPDEIDFVPVGRARLVFYDCDAGVAELEAFDEVRVTQLRPLAKTMRIGCRLPINAVDSNLADKTGSWFDPKSPGQGFVLTWLATGQALVNWFTNDPSGDQYWIQGVGEYLDGAVVFPDLYSTSASRFGLFYDPDLFSTMPWGQMSLELDCLEGLANYQSALPEFGSGTMELRRLTIPRELECAD